MKSTISKQKRFTRITGTLAALLAVFLMSGCAAMKLSSTVVKDDVATSPQKGYVSFEFTTEKSMGEYVFDKTVELALVVLGGNSNRIPYLEVARVSENSQTPLLWRDIQNLTRSHGDRFRWVAEAPGKYTYRITYIDYSVFFDRKVVFGDVTVDVQENLITPVKVYYFDFYDEHGNPKKADANAQKAAAAPNLELGSEQTMGNEKFHIGDPSPVASEQSKYFTSNKN